MEILETHGKKMENIKISCRKQGFLSKDLCKTTILRSPWPAHKMQSLQKKTNPLSFFVLLPSLFPLIALLVMHMKQHLVHRSCQ